MRQETNDIQPTPIQQAGQIVLYQPDDSISLEVKLDVDEQTVWLTQPQMVQLFDSSKANISEHITNIYQQGELTQEATVRKFRTVRKEGNRMVTRNLDYYNLDMIISVGFRVNSKKGIIFRQWANATLKDHLLKGYSISRQLVAMQERTDERFMQIEHRLDDQKKQVEFLVDMHRPSTDRIFPTGCVFDAYEYVSALIRSAKDKVTLIDNYCDERTLTLLAKRPDSVACTIHTRYNESFKEDLAKHNRQYPEIKMVQLPHQAHDRFLILDNDVFILGDSIKDLGHSLTTVLKTGFTPDEILSKLK